MQPADEEKTTAAWVEAGRNLGFEVTAPFPLATPHGTRNCIAYLPHFSGPRGLVIFAMRPPAFDTDAELVAAAEASGYAWSHLNVRAYQYFHHDSFIEALREWGYTGPIETRPTWL